jgi:hypothetical protein
MRNLSGACQLQEKFSCGHMHSKRWARCTEKLSSEISGPLRPAAIASGFRPILIFGLQQLGHPPTFRELKRKLRDTNRGGDADAFRAAFLSIAVFTAAGFGLALSIPLRRI